MHIRILNNKYTTEPIESCKTPVYLNHLEWGDMIKFVDIDHSCLNEIQIDYRV